MREAVFGAEQQPGPVSTSRPLGLRPPDKQVWTLLLQRQHSLPIELK
jgi:hypothetical protein